MLESSVAFFICARLQSSKARLNLNGPGGAIVVQIGANVEVSSM
jgi:hypothetical protein